MLNGFRGFLESCKQISFLKIQFLQHLVMASFGGAQQRIPMVADAWLLEQRLWESWEGHQPLPCSLGKTWTGPAGTRLPLQLPVHFLSGGDTLPNNSTPELPDLHHDSPQIHFIIHELSVTGRISENLAQGSCPKSGSSW